MFSRHKTVGIILYLMAILGKRFQIANAQSFDGCPAETVSNSQGYYTWDQVDAPGDQLFVSHGFRCLNEHKHYVTRKCEASRWVPKDVNCSYAIDEYKILNACPPEYKPILGELNNIRLCVHISVDQQLWTDTCLKSGSSFTYNLDEDNTILLNRHIVNATNIAVTDVWLPASKIWFTNAMFRIGNPIQWNLAGTYGADVSVHYEIADTFRNMDGCLRSNRSSGEYIVTKCTDSYYHLCLYNQMEPTMMEMSCTSSFGYGYQTTRYSKFQDICIGIERFETLGAENVNDTYVKEVICDNGNVFTIDSGYTLHIFRELARDARLTESHRCLFQIIPDKITVTKADWDNFNEVRFVNWAFETTFEEESETTSMATTNPILAARLNGEWEWANEVNCAICSIKNEIQMSTMSFHALHEEGKLFLRVENFKFLWRDDYAYADGISCFTLIYGPNDVSRIKQIFFITENATGSVAFYKIFTIGEGWYWCTGLQMGTFETIKAEIRLGIITFAIIIQTTALEVIDSILYNVLTPLQPYISNEHPSLMWYDRNNVLFHVDLWINTPEYLTFEDNHLNLSEPMLSAYFIQQKLYNATANTTLLSFNSTQYCLPSSISQLDEINFSGCRLGHYTTSIELCLLPSQLPITKKCIGDSLFGGMWMNGNIPKPNCSNDLQSDVTQKLHNLINSNDKADRIVSNMIDIVLDTCSVCLNGADIFYISQFMKSFEDSMSTLPLNHTVLLRVLQLYDRLLMINDTVANTAASLNATNVLLSSLDVILINVNMSYIQIGIRSIVQPMLTSFKFYTNETNVTGVAMIGNASDIQWNKYVVRYLYRNETIADILNIPNLVIASYLPDILISSLANAQLPITISFFMNDVLFQTNDADSVIETVQPSIKSNGKILSVILPIKTSHLTHTLPIFIKPSTGTLSNGVCGYWDYTNNIDGWATNGCIRNDSVTTGVVLCECTHLTNFAYLFNGYDSYSKIPAHHLDRLELVTIIGCSFSLAGILFIFLTALLFKKWRNSSSSKVLLQFSITIGFEMGMVLFVNTEENTETFVLKNQTLACIASGVLTHYFVIATFFWMLVIGYMQLMRYVVVFHTFTPRFVIKSSLLAWGIPIVIIVLVLSVNPYAYLPKDDDFMSKICYPSGYALYFGVMTPIFLIILANLLIFVMVVKSLVIKNNDVRSRHHDKSIVLSQLRLSIFLFFSLGLTWIFAFLSMTEAKLIFTYLFCFTSTMQGFILFIYFILLDPISRDLWKNLMVNKLGNFVRYNK